MKGEYPLVGGKYREVCSRRLTWKLPEAPGKTCSMYSGRLGASMFDGEEPHIHGGPSKWVTREH